MSETQRFVASPGRPLWLAEVLADLRRRDDNLPCLLRLSPGVLGRTPTPSDDSWGQLKVPTLAGCTPVVLDAVSDWWDEQDSSTWPHPSLNAMGRLPWPKVWVEWEDKFMSGGATARGQYLSGRAGARLEELSADALSEAIAANLRCDRLSGDVQSLLRRYDLWVTAMVVIEARPGAMWSYAPIAWPVDAEGRPVREGADPSQTDPWAYLPMAGNGTRESAAMTFESLNIWRLFTALLSVKNIETADVPISKKQRKRLARLDDHGPPPWVHYKTLAITLPAEHAGPRSGGDGIQQAIPFHLVRGHLADYSKGPGLFGQWRGVVWKPMHSRGLQRVGAIAKTYSAKMAEGGAS